MKLDKKIEDAEEGSTEEVAQNNSEVLDMELKIDENCFGDAKEKLNSTSNESSPSASSYETVGNDFADFTETIKKTNENNHEIKLVTSEPHQHAVIITDASVDVVNLNNADEEKVQNDNLSTVVEESQTSHNSLDALQEPKSVCVSPASSNGGIYSVSI